MHIVHVPLNKEVQPQCYKEGRELVLLVDFFNKTERSNRHQFYCS